MSSYAAGRGVLDPQLGGDEELVAGDSAGPDRRPDRFLVAVGGRSIQLAVTGCEGGFNRGLGFLVRDLVDAEAEDRHLDAVVEVTYS